MHYKNLIREGSVRFRCFNALGRDCGYCGQGLGCFRYLIFFSCCQEPGLRNLLRHHGDLHEGCRVHGVGVLRFRP